MSKSDDIVQLVVAASALGRIAANATHNETPAAQWRTLSILRSEGPQRLGDLARLSRVTQPGMTRLVHSLVDEGLVARASDPADSRATVLHVTRAGIRVLDAWQAELGTALEPLFEDVSDEDWHALTTAARVLSERITLQQERTS